MGKVLVCPQCQSFDDVELINCDEFRCTACGLEYAREEFDDVWIACRVKEELACYGLDFGKFFAIVSELLDKKEIGNEAVRLLNNNDLEGFVGLC